MAAHATTYRPLPATGPCTATVIVLDGEPTIRLEQGPYLLGYFADVTALGAHVDLATVEMIAGTA